ncbi:hypothetical protein [Lysobacter enzymogenes]|uniref:hypothetical protein n=1 Tax=Lysobacter enzymogenes TaxID=69 RepID=UPI0019D0BF08|nr:hypothetical protein [Lysobacter enzymogenes]
MSAVNIADLKKSVDQIFEHILISGISKVELKEQYYWMVDPKKKYDMSVEPTGLVVGDLACDLGVVKDIGSCASEALAYQLTLIAPLLVYVSEEAARELSSQGG